MIGTASSWISSKSALGWQSRWPLVWETRYLLLEIWCSLVSQLSDISKIPPPPQGRSHYQNNRDQSSWATELTEMWLVSTACLSLNNATLSRLNGISLKSYPQLFLCWRRCFGHMKLMHHENNFREWANSGVTWAVKWFHGSCQTRHGFFTLTARRVRCGSLISFCDITVAFVFLFKFIWIPQAIRYKDKT